MDAQLDSGYDEFVLVLNEAMATEAGKHVELYTRKVLHQQEGRRWRKGGVATEIDRAAGWCPRSDYPCRAVCAVQGLLTKVAGISGLAEWMSSSEGVKRAANATALLATLGSTFEEYNTAASTGKDAFGKTYFHNGPFTLDGTLHAGRIVPVLHYCMGGITFNEQGEAPSA